jgi:hypothetical protein
MLSNVNGSNMKQAWFHHPNGSVTILRIDGKTVTPLNPTASQKSGASRR